MTARAWPQARSKWACPWPTYAPACIAPAGGGPSAHDSAEAGPDHIILVEGNDGQFAKSALWRIVPNWPRTHAFARNQDRFRHRAVLVPMPEALFKTRDKPDWLALLDAAEVPCGAINNLAEVFADPQVQYSAPWSPTGSIRSWTPGCR